MKNELGTLRGTGWLSPPQSLSTPRLQTCRAPQTGADAAGTHFKPGIPITARKGSSQSQRRHGAGGSGVGGLPKTERNRWPSDVNSQYTFWRLTGTGDHNLSLQKRPGLKGRSERQPVLESWTRACFLTLPLGYIWAFSPRSQCVHKGSFVGQQRPCDCSRQNSSCGP